MSSSLQPLSITLQESKSTAVLTYLWQRKIMPYLCIVLLRMCAAIFICALICIIMALTNGPVGGLALFTTTIFVNLLALSKLVTDWFSGSQAAMLCYACLVTFIACLKVFRLRLKNYTHTSAHIDHRAIVVRKNWLDIIASETTIHWYELALVSVRKKSANSKFDEYLCFNSFDGKNVELDAACLNDSRLHSSLIAWIKRYAPNALSSELEERRFSGDAIDYSDIWMDTLHQKQNRQRNGELERGACLSNERFQVVRKLGSGGQGTAYLATVQYLCDQVLDEGNTAVEMVVLKEFILPGFDNPALLSEIVARIQHEALLLKSLNHRQIVRVVDAFIEDLRGYLVIEHVQGTSLRDFVSSHGPLSESRAIELAYQMCSILEYLHGHAPQVVHRDFTPDNLLIDRSGMLKLIDFNLAKVPNLDETAVCVGRPGYTAPEQVRGCPEPASDFYSMGALLYFLLTGEDPEPLTSCSPRAVKADLSLSFNVLVERLTDQDTSRRINSADQVRKALAVQKVEAA